MEVIGIPDQYLILVAITLFFSALALTRKSLMLSLMSTIFWFFMAGITPAVIGGVMLSFTYLCLMVAIIFLILSFHTALGLLDERKKKKEWLGELEEW